MKETSLNPNSWVSKFLKRNFNSLPKDTCDLGKKLFWSVLFLPITWIGLITPTSTSVFVKDNWGFFIENAIIKSLGIYLLILLPYGFGHMTIIETEIFNKEVYWVYTYMIGLIVLSILAGILIGGLVLLLTVSEKIEDHDKSIIPKALKESFKSWKEKYCKKINWSTPEKE